jgi:hypothetical protein
MSTTAWAHLPNAPHIDRILADLRARPQVWDSAWASALASAWDSALASAWDSAYDSARDSAWGALAALIAWDDCAVLLDAPVEHVRALAVLGNEQAVLMLPACIVFNQTES